MVDPVQEKATLEETDPETPGSRKKKGKDKTAEALSQLSLRVADMEDNIGMLGEMIVRLEKKLETSDSFFQKELGDLKRSIQSVTLVGAEKERRLSQVESLVQANMRDLSAGISSLKIGVEKLKREHVIGATMGASSSSGGWLAGSDLPKPKPFAGERDAKEVDNFCWQMGQYLEARGISDEPSKIATASAYLTDMAMLWWRRKHQEIRDGLCRIDSWDVFQKELRRQFFPGNESYEARRKLRELKQRSSVREYVKQFTSLMLMVPDMGKDDLLFNFIDGLSTWAQREVLRKEAKTIDEAIRTAESLADFDDRSKESPRPKRRSNSKGEKPDTSHKDESESDHTEGERRKHKPKCFLCKGPHLARQCPTGRKS